jgi:hypothetical protein
MSLAQVKIKHRAGNIAAVSRGGKGEDKAEFETEPSDSSRQLLTSVRVSERPGSDLAFDVD